MSRQPLHIAIIGLGGIGTGLAEPICRFLNYSQQYSSKVLLVDGDHYVPKNYDRQNFLGMGNKAEVKADELAVKFENIEFNIFNAYINQDNISNVIEDNMVIFACVDNHKSRMVINNYCKTLHNITLISGGNDLEDGNVQFYVRRGGEDLTSDMCEYHPEIANPDDKLPDEMSCEELSKSEPQLIFTNLGAAVIMCWVFYNVVVKNQYNHARSEAYFDILKLVVDSKIRLLNP